MGQKILLTAANGRTGRPVLKALSERGAQVRVFVRNEEQFADLEALGAHDFVSGDLDSSSDLKIALSNMDRVLHIGPPMHPNETEITNTLVDASVDAGIEHFVYYSVMHPLRREVRHHRLKLDAEEHLIESGLSFTIVQPSRYMQHLTPIWNAVIESGVLSMPFSVEKKFNIVDLEDLAQASAIVATKPGHEYAIYELAGPEALSQNDMARIISDVIGKPVKAQALDLKTMETNARGKGASQDRIEQMLIMNRHYDRHGFRGNSNVLAMILGRAPGDFHSYVTRIANEE